MELSAQLHHELESEINVGVGTVSKNFSIGQETVLIMAAALAGFFFKLAIAYNTFGTNDVASFYMFAGSLRDHGLEWTYRNGVVFFSNFPVFNHPPLTAYYLELIDNLSKNPFLREYGLTFPFLLRLPGIIADLVSVFVLIRIRQFTLRLRIPNWAMLLFALSPVSVMVSGFHGNTDSILVMFLLLAAYACLRERPVWCGIFFALSCQVKIIPFLLLPIFWFFWQWRQAAMRFILPVALVTAAFWIQPLVRFPLLFFRNVVSYNSFWGSWGISYCLKLTAWSQFKGGFFYLPTGATIVVWMLKAAIISAVIAIAWHRRHSAGREFLNSLAYAWIVFFILAPGVCPQYLVWPAPFILLLSPILYGWFTIASSVALFCFYNSLTGGLPWYIGIARNNADGFGQSALWALLPWFPLIVGIIFFWKSAISVNSAPETETA
jgi:Gpi18-like mannosyltransferase